jgi:SAM-dependent methyltransferase
MAEQSQEPDNRPLHDYHAALLLAHLREVGARQGGAAPDPSLPNRSPLMAELTNGSPAVALPPVEDSGAHQVANWDRFQRHLLQAEQNAHIGTHLPRTRYGGFKKRLARLVARAVFWVGRIIINPQRQFNVSVLDTLRDVQNSIKELERAQQGFTRPLEMRYQRLEGLFGQQDRAVTERLDALKKVLGNLKVSFLWQERRISLLLEEARRRLPGPMDADQVRTFVTEEDHQLDALYLTFEDQFRGSRADIKEKLKVYLPLLREAGAGTEAMPVLDVGCGRGEWLELLKEEGLVAEGVDLNRVLLQQCRERGLRVTEGDVIAHLRDLRDNTLGAVSGFHIIEHLPFPVLIKLFDETVRVLKPGGLAIFETPNPENVLVGSCYFYADPTHRNPIFPPTIEFLAEQRGLVDVRIVPLPDHSWTREKLELLPPEHPMAETLNPVLELVKARFHCGADFAVVGRKAK